MLQKPRFLTIQLVENVIQDRAQLFRIGFLLNFHLKPIPSQLYLKTVTKNCKPFIFRTYTPPHLFQKIKYFGIPLCTKCDEQPNATFFMMDLPRSFF